MYVLAVMLSISTQTTIKNIDKMGRKIFWSEKEWLNKKLCCTNVPLY